MPKNTSMNGALFVVTPKATIQNVNPAACMLLGYAADELIDQPIRMVFAEESLFKDAGVEVIIREGTFSDVELTLRTKDSRSIPVLFSSLVMRDEKGEIQSIVCVAQDITGQKQMEGESREYREHIDELVEERTTELARSRDYIENILASMTDALIVVGPGAIIQSVNKATRDLLGYNEDELIGMPIGNIFAEEEEEEDDDLLFTEKILSMVRCKLQGIYEKDKEGFLALLETAPLGVVMVDSTGKIVMVNTRTESLFGYEKKELLGHSIDILLPEEYRQAHAEHRRGFMSDPVPRPMGKGRILKAQRKDGPVFEAEIGLSVIWVKGKIHVISIIWDASLAKHWQLIKLTPFGQLFAEEEEEEEEEFRGMDKKLVTKSGNKIPVLMSGSVMRDKGSTIQGAVLVAKDITERKRMETELKARASQQLAVGGLGQLALAGTDLSTLMDEAVSFVAQTLEVEYCKILELLPDGNALLLRAGVGWKEGYVGHATVGTGPDSQAGYTLLCNEPVIVEDLRTETRFSGPPLLHDHRVVSGISAVIYGKNQPFGVLGAHTTQSRTFTQDDVHFIQAIANVLAEAIERKQAEEELRILNTIMEAVHKSSDLKKVFNIAIDKVMELTDIDIVGIYLVDENRNEAVLEAHRGYPDKYIERAGRIPYPKGVTWKVINSGETYIVQDVATDPYVGSVGKESGFQSFMSVPIKIGDRAIGAIHFHSYKKNKFGKREVGLFSSIGTQIAIAVTKAKQRKDLQLVNEDLSLLNTIAATVHKSLSLKEVYNIVLNAVVEITAFDIIMIYLVDEDTNEAVLQAHRGLTEDYIKGAGRIPYPKGVTWKAINSGELTLIDDLQKDPDLGPAGRALGHRTMLAVPIKQEEKTIGLVVFASRRVLELTSRDINLLNAIGSQIGTAIVQAYLYEKSQRQAEELRDLYEDLNKRNKDLEILNTVTQAVHQSLELEEIYNVALDMVTSMENVDMAMIYLVDEDRKEAILQAHRNMPEDYIRRAGIIPYPKGTTWRVINTGEIVNIEDAQKDPDIGPAGRDLGHHGILGIPITLQGKVIGVIWFLSYKERQFDKQEMDLLSSLGNQIAIATVKAKLYGELSKKNRYETIISTVTRSVHQSINLQEVLENAVEAMSKNIDGADHVAIYLAEGEEAVLRAYRGHPDWFIERVRRIPYPKGFTWKTIIEGKPRYCPDVDQDTFIGPAGREVGTKSYLSMPIHYEGKTVGVINIHSLQKNAFNEEDRKLLEIVMQQIETAVNNARQAAALREARDELESKVAERTKELVQANIQLKEIDRHKSEFLATMSHELRTPLNSIIGFSEMLLGKTFGDLNEKQKRYINNVLLSGRHLLRLINDILDLSRVEAGQMEPQLEEFSPAEALSEVEAIVKPTADKKGLKLEFSIDNGVKTIWADEGKFKQVMYNLLSNAIKFTESGWVSVKAKLVQGVEDLIEVNIEDTGIGIKAEDMGKLFKEFEQIEGGISRRYEGTGLGLALSKKLVELHGGEIWAESEYGKGSKFTFSLPLRVRSGKEIKEFSDSVDFRVGMVGPKAIELTTEKVYGEGDTLILVVEDDNKAAEILEAYLRDAGYSVARAYNGEDALEKTRDLKPFAITLDILLPNKKDGWDVLKELKESPETRNIPVVIISVVDDKNLGFSLGAVDYLVKPLTRVELLGSLRKLSLKPDFRFETSNVLIIDDNPGMVELISDILRKEGINMIQAYGGREGIDLASQRNPDLIILDLMMPEVNGFDLIAELKKYQKTKYIPLLVFTAKELTEEDKKKLNGHVERVVRKGNFSPRDFIDEIKKFELMNLRKSSVNEGIRGLSDYSVFISYLNNELSRAKRHGGTHSLAVIEFCNFENNNEALSRDKVLINTAQLIINYIYPYDLLAKLEEGRFIWMLPWTNQDLSKRAAERVRSLVEQHSSSVTVSIEIVTYPDDGDTYEKLLDKALRALSEATLRREVCS